MRLMPVSNQVIFPICKKFLVQEGINSISFNTQNALFTGIEIIMKAEKIAW